MATFHRLVRFVSKSGGEPLIGEPVERDQDVGLATYAGEAVEVEVFAGRSVLQPGERTGKKEQVERLLSPLAASEVGTIRCIGLNVSQLRAFLPPQLSSSSGTVHVDFLAHPQVPEPCERSQPPDPGSSGPLHEAVDRVKRPVPCADGSSQGVRERRLCGLRVGARCRPRQGLQECLGSRSDGLRARVSRVLS